MFLNNQARSVLAAIGPEPPGGNDDDAKLLLQFPPAENPPGTPISGGDTIFDASVGGGHAVEPIGTPTITTLNPSPISDSDPGTPASMLVNAASGLRLASGLDDFLFGTGPLTIEGFFRFDAVGNQVIWDFRTSVGSNALALWIWNGELYVSYAGTTTDGLVWPSHDLVADTWYHIAIVRDGANAAMFVGGDRKASNTSTAWNITAAHPHIARNYSGTNDAFAGQIDEFRVSKGIARYDPTQTSITVPAGPFTPKPVITGNDANTKILLHMDQTPGTGGTTNKALGSTMQISSNEAVRVTDQPIPDRGSLNACWQWGTADRTTFADGGDFISGTVNFDIQFFMRRTADGSARVLGQGTGTTNWGLAMLLSGTNRIQVAARTADSNFSVTGNTETTLNVWHHVRALRVNGQLYIYLDGNLDVADGGVAFAHNVAYGANGFGIGGLGGTGSIGYAGQLDEFIYKYGGVDGDYGIGDFTPPRLPYGPDAR